MPETVGIERFAEIMHVSVGHAQRLVREGKAPRHFKLGRKVYFVESDIFEWVGAHIVNPENK